MAELQRVLVVGAGVAGTTAAETLRLKGFDGELTIAGAERHSPYHRPPLSKRMLAGTVHRAGIDLAPRLDVDARVLRSTRAVGLDLGSRTALFRDGGRELSVEFDGLVVATGASARPWPDGPAPDGVLVLRTVEDCFAIRDRLGSSPRVVVVGGGFIGAEVAATCRELGLAVTLVERGSAPMAAVLGEEMARCWAELHRGHGVELRTGVGVDALIGDGQVEAVRLSDGTRVPADLVILGLGVTPDTAWLDGSGLLLDDGVVCDASGVAEGGDGVVVAAGDIARWWHPRYEQHLRIEHWEHARQQGVVAAQTLLDGPRNGRQLCDLPYFWSDQFDVKMQMLGATAGYDAVAVIEGDPRDGGFLAAYGKQGRTIAVLSTIPGRVHAYREAVAEGAAFPPDRIG